VAGSTVAVLQWYLCFRSTFLHAGRMLERCTCTVQVYIAADKLALAKAAKQSQNTLSGTGRLASQVHLGNSG